MHRRRSTLLLIILLLAGAIIGSFAADAVKDALPLAAESVRIGIIPAMTLNLSVLTATVGFALALNLGGIVGMVVGILVYRRL